MPIEERERHRLHERLDEVLGPEEAVTLMRHLPPVGWGDVARRSDLNQLEGRLESRLDASIERVLGRMHRELGQMHRELGQVRGDMLSSHRQLVFAIIASQFTAVSLAFAAASL